MSQKSSTHGSAEELRLEAYTFGNTSNVPMCYNCKHFTVHYVLTDKLHMIDCGHCGFPRIKNRRSYDLCEHHSYR